MSSRRNRVIPILMITIIILIIILFIININNKEEILYKYNGTYSKEIEYYLNNNLYSTSHIIIKLNDGELTYTKTIDYQDGTEYHYQETSEYKEEDNRISSSKYTLYLDNDSLCLTQKDCTDYLSKDKEVTYKNNLDLNLDDYITNIKKINKTQDKQIYLIIENDDYKTIINHLIYNYDISINILNINEIPKDLKSNYINEYQIVMYPTILILDKDKVAINDNTFTEENLSKILEKQGFKSR